MGIERVGLHLVVKAVDRLFEHGAHHRATGAAQQRLQHQEFAARQVERETLDARLAMFAIEGEAAEPHGPARHVAGAAQHGAQPRQQFLDGEGLGQIVVRPGIEAGDAVGDLAAGGEQDHRHAPRTLGAGAQLRQQAETVAIRQLAVEQHGVMDAVGQGLLRLRQRRHMIEHDVVPAQCSP